MSIVSARSLAALALVFTVAAAPSAASADPGEASAPRTNRSSEAAREDGPSSGLKAIYRKFGRQRLSVDAAGGASSLTVRADKPTGKAKVLKAYLFTSVHFVPELPDLSVSLEGQPVKWMARQPNVFGDYIAGVADVTKIVRGKLDDAGKGVVKFSVKENGLAPGGYYDGHVLAVVFSAPDDPKPRTIALLFGGAISGGEAFGLTLAKPIDPKSKNARAEMGLGISGSYQGTTQYTIVDVNGRRLTSSAGGQDDGAPAESGLITVGGLGDKPNTPPPNAAPSGARTDDERYSLLKFITKKTRAIEVRTLNPSGDDNLFFAWFDLSADTEDEGKDSDGDGLLDVWEAKGYDHDGDGKVDVDLKKLGADPKKKDIFIAYAWMRARSGESLSHEPTAAVLKDVADAFARAPVENPDGSTGIAVHFRNLGGVDHVEDLNPVWTGFDAIMDPLLTAAERRIYRRMLNAHAYNGGGSSGIARDIPASDFVESLGKFSSNPGTQIQRAGTIMHELGHTLGLRHGGVDHVNYKPNHLSVMSYNHQLDWLIRDGAPFLDYERFSLGDIDETALSEPAGLEAAGAETELARYGVRWSHPFFSGLLSKTTGANANVDWNVSGAIDASAFAQDVNRSGARTVLRAGFVEWDNVILDGGLVGASSKLDQRRSLVTAPDDLRELSEQDYLELKQQRRRR